MTSPDRPSPAPLRVLVADDHERVRRGVCNLLAALPGIDVVGAAADGAEAVALARALRPEVVLMDIAMPVMDGIEATRRITSENPCVRVVVLTALQGREQDALAAGAAGQLLKDASPAELIGCLRRVAGAPAP